MRQLGILTTLLILLLSAKVHCQVSPYKVQSLFIYNFTKHIKWPGSSPTFTIGILGKSEMSTELSTSMKGKQVDGKAIEVKIIASPQDALNCQMVYVPASKSKEIVEVISTIGNKDVLVVTENDLSDKGAAISFLTVDEKLRFKINQDVLNKGGMQVSGGLLSLALR